MSSIVDPVGEAARLIRSDSKGRMLVAADQRDARLDAFEQSGQSATGDRSAVIYTIIESARRHGHEPCGYLKDLLERLPGMKAGELDALLPVIRVRYRISLPAMLVASTIGRGGHSLISDSPSSRRTSLLITRVN